MIRGHFPCKGVITNPSVIPDKYSNLAVVLLGWAGCQDKYLAKYSRIYEKRGIPTLRCTVAIEYPALRHAIVDARFTKPLVEPLKKFLENPSRRIIFHFFSMNSMFSLSSIFASYGPHLMDRADAAIFDSCPAEYAGGFAHVLDFIAPRTYPTAGPLTLATLKYILLQMNDLNEYKLRALSALDGKPEKREIYHWTRSVEMPKKQLYIYSRNDDACPPESIDAFREDQISRRGAITQRLFFEDSEHVQHLREHPEEYANCVNKFVDDVVSK